MHPSAPPAQIHQPIILQTPREKNGLGVAAFIVSVLGIFTAGLLSPIGLVLSLIALGRAPRGWAVVGLILGFVGSLVWVAAGLAVIVGMVAVAAAAGAVGVGLLAMFEPEQVEITADMARTAMAVQLYEEQTDTLPTDLDHLGLRPAVQIDPWGHAYVYQINSALDPGFDLVSAGPDGQLDSADDISLSRLDHAWELAMADFGDQIEDLERSGVFDKLFNHGSDHWQSHHRGVTEHSLWHSGPDQRTPGERIVIMDPIEPLGIVDAADLDDEIVRLQSLIAELERSIADGRMPAPTS